MSGEADTVAPVEDGAERPLDSSAGISTLTMLDALRSNPDDPGKALLGALAGESGGPQADLLIKLLSEQGGSRDDALRAAIREEVLAEQAEAVVALEDTARRLFAEREAACARLETLAAALGACPVCFGEDLLCDTCHGAGAPGARAPDPHEFNRLVAPALESARAVMRRAAARRPWARPTEAFAPSPTPSFPNPTHLNGGLTS